MLVRVLLLVTCLCLPPPFAWAAGPIHIVDVTSSEWAQDSRLKLCDVGSPIGSRSLHNEKGKRLSAFLGHIEKVRVRYFSDDWGRYENVEVHLRVLMASRPEALSMIQDWAEAADITSYGIIAEVDYGSGAQGLIEIAAKNHLCFKDEQGRYWWARIAL